MEPSSKPFLVETLAEKKYSTHKHFIHITSLVYLSPQFVLFLVNHAFQNLSVCPATFATMPIDNTIFRDHVRLRERQRAERNASNTLLNLSFPVAGTLDGPSDTSTRPRHHFRRGAISEASGRPILPAVDARGPAPRQQVRIRSRNINEIDITIVPSPRHHQLSTNSTDQTQADQWRGLADQIHRGLVNINSPRVQEQINRAVATLHSSPNAVPTHSVMETSASARDRDTHRYGREGWWTVEHESAASHRPATIPGSNFAVPHSTLNLFQSVDLFAPLAPRPTVRESICAFNHQVDLYFQHLEGLFNNVVAARRTGRAVPSGKLFIVSMELSRVKQLRSILDQESRQFLQAEREAHTARQRGRRNAEAGSSEECLTHEQSPDIESDDDSTISEMDEPEGWTDLDFVLDDDYPREVCFHIGSRQLTFPIEDVEDWMMDGRRRQRRTPRTMQVTSQPPWPGTARGPARRDGRRILHTLAMPETLPAPWLDNAWHGYGDLDNEEGVHLFAGGDGDIPDTEYEDEYEDEYEGEYEGEYEEEYEEEDNGDETGEDLNHEGWGNLAPQDSQAAEQIRPDAEADAEDDAQSQGTPSHVPLVDLTGSPPPPAPNAHVPLIALTTPSTPATWQTISRNTSDESNPATVTSSEREDQQGPDRPHPVHGWTVDHSLFMFSCRGNIFDVTRQLQHAFGFDPELSPHMVGERLNGECAARHRGFIVTFLPGEEGTNMRASRREFLHLRLRHFSNEDVYHGTQDIVEGNLGGEDYERPPLPAMAPDCWDRALDICLLQDLHRGGFDFESFWNRHREALGGTPLSAALRGFLGVRLAQVRYLGITEEELSAAQEPLGCGQSY